MHLWDSNWLSHRARRAAPRLGPLVAGFANYNIALVYGFVEQKTPRSFITACDRFIYTENVTTKPVGAAKAAAPVKSGPMRDLASDEAFKAALDQSVDAATTEGGRANLGTVGSHLVKLLPDFDARNYGFAKLSDLVERFPRFRLIREKTAGGGRVVYVERK